MKVFGYIRVSTADQANSLQVQLDRIKDYCRYNSMELVQVFIDEDVSGFKPISTRPQGLLMLGALSSGQAEGIVAVKIDRLFRNTVDALTTAEDLKAKNINLFIADQGGVTVDYQSANGKFVFTLLAASAQYERDKTSDRTTDVLTHKKKSGMVYCRPVFGYDNVEGRLVENEAEMEVVRFILSERMSGKSFSLIANFLNQKGVRAKGGGAWFAPGIQKVFNKFNLKKVA